MSERPFRVWSATRECRKSMIASNLQGLIKKAKEKLQYSANADVSLVLEEDGTEVDEDEYFQFLPSDTTFILLKAGEKWTTEDDQLLHNKTPDEPDGEGVELCDVESDQVEAFGDYSVSPRRQTVVLNRLTHAILSNVANIITFSNEDLQLLVDTSSDDLQQYLSTNYTMRDVRELQDSIQNKLDERREATEAISLLKMYSNQNKKRKQPNTD